MTKYLAGRIIEFRGRQSDIFNKKTKDYLNGLLENPLLEGEDIQELIYSLVSQMKSYVSLYIADPICEDAYRYSASEFIGYIRLFKTFIDVEIFNLQREVENNLDYSDNIKNYIPCIWDFRDSIQRFIDKEKPCSSDELSEIFRQQIEDKND